MSKKAAKSAERPTLKPGTYALTQDVANPGTRKRGTSWASVEVFAKGMRFSIAAPAFRSKAEHVPMLRQQRTDEKTEQGSPVFDALTAHLEPVAEIPSDLLDRQEWSLMAPKILDQLFRDHAITVKDVKKAAEKFLAINRVDYFCTPFAAYIFAKDVTTDEHGAYRVILSRTADGSKAVLWVVIYPEQEKFQVVQQLSAVEAGDAELHAKATEFLEKLQSSLGFRRI
jgi:hypothetical protein